MRRNGLVESARLNGHRATFWRLAGDGQLLARMATARRWKRGQARGTETKTGAVAGRSGRAQGVVVESLSRRELTDGLGCGGGKRETSSSSSGSSGS